MTDYVPRNGLYVPEADKLTAWRQRKGIPVPDKEVEQKALRDLKNAIGLFLIEEARKVEHLFGTPEQGAGALQCAMVAAIDAAAEGLAAYQGKNAAIAVLRGVEARLSASAVPLA